MRRSRQRRTNIPRVSVTNDSLACKVCTPYRDFTLSLCRETFWQVQPPHSPAGSFRRDQPTEAAPQIRLSSLNHASVEAVDVAALADFYVNVLGFKVLDRPDLPFDGKWLQGGDLTLHIIEEDPSVPKHVHHWQVSIHLGSMLPGQRMICLLCPLLECWTQCPCPQHAVLSNSSEQVQRASAELVYQKSKPSR